MTDSRPGPLRPGAFWRELSTGRRIRIVEPFVNGIGPSWTYVDSLGGSIPNSERYPDVYFHCSDIFDFSTNPKFVCEDDLLILGLRPSDIVDLTDEELDQFESYGRTTFEIVAASRRAYATGWVPFPESDLRVDPKMLSVFISGRCLQRMPDGLLLVREPLVRMLVLSGAMAIEQFAPIHDS